MEKNYSCFLLFFILFFSCSNDNDENLLTDINSDVDTSSIQVVPFAGDLTRSSYKLLGSNTILQFKDEQTMLQTAKKLSLMSREEREAWNKQFNNFKSLDQLFIEAMEDAEKIDFTESEYKEYKEKYQDFLYFPEYLDDYGTYVPIKERHLAYISDIEGRYMIGNEIVQLEKISNYEELIQADHDIIYDKVDDENETSPLSRNYSNEPPSVDYKNKFWGQVASGWYKEKKGRKLQIKVGRRSQNSGNVGVCHLEVEVTFRKKGAFGAWYNYRSETSTQVKCNGNVIYGPIRKTGYSSHDTKASGNLGFQGVWASSRIYPALDFEVTTYFQGFGKSVTYKGVLPARKVTGF